MCLGKLRLFSSWDAFLAFVDASLGMQSHTTTHGPPSVMQFMESVVNLKFDEDPRYEMYMREWQHPSSP